MPMVTSVYSKQTCGVIEFPVIQDQHWPSQVSGCYLPACTWVRGGLWVSSLFPFSECSVVLSPKRKSERPW